MRLPRRTVLLPLALVVLAASCGDADADSPGSTIATPTTTTTRAAQGATTTPPPTTTQPAPTAPAPAPTTTALDPQPAAGPPWARVPDGDGVFAAATVSAVTAVGGGYVASGTVGGPTGPFEAAVWSSPDGVAWQRAAAPEGELFVNDLLLADVGLVAAGIADSGAAVWIAQPGGQWQRVLEDRGLPNSAFVQATAVAAASSGLVAVGELAVNQRAEPLRAAVWTSDHGDIWERRDDDSFGDDAASFTMTDVAASGDRVVAVGVVQTGDGESDPAAWYSGDGGVSWSAADVPPDLGGGFAGMSGVAVGGPGFVAVGFDQSISTTAAVWTSTDGAAWERVEHDTEVFGGDLDAFMRMNAVAAAGGRLVAAGFVRTGLGFSPAIWESADGATWRRASAPEGGWGAGAEGIGFDVAASGGAFLAVGGDAGRGLLWISPPPPDLPDEPPPSSTTTSTTVPEPIQAPDVALSASLFPDTISGPEPVTAYVSGVRAVPTDDSGIVLVWLFDEATGEPVQRVCRPPIDARGNQVVCTFLPGTTDRPLPPGRYLLGVGPADADPAGGEFALVHRDVLIVTDG